MRRLLQPKNRMVSTTPSKSACYISILNIIQGDVDPTDVRFLPHLPNGCVADRPTGIRCTNRCCAFASGSSPTSSRGAPHRSRSRSRASRPTSAPRTASAGSCSRTTPASPPYTSLLLLLGNVLTKSVQLFKRMIDQFDRLRKRNAFVEQYKKEKMFENGLEEFDDAR